MKTLIVDRIEGKIVLCEDEALNISEIPMETIEGMVKDGDVIVLSGDRYIINKEETDKRKKYIEELMKGMWEK